MEQFEEAVRWLAEALKRSDSYVDEIRLDPALTALVNNEVFDQLTNLIDVRNSRVSDIYQVSKLIENLVIYQCRKRWIQPDLVNVAVGSF